MHTLIKRKLKQLYYYQEKYTSGKGYDNIKWVFQNDQEDRAILNVYALKYSFKMLKQKAERNEKQKQTHRYSWRFQHFNEFIEYMNTKNKGF